MSRGNEGRTQSPTHSAASRARSVGSGTSFKSGFSDLSTKEKLLPSFMRPKPIGAWGLPSPSTASSSKYSPLSTVPTQASETSPQVLFPGPGMPVLRGAVRPGVDVYDLFVGRKTNGNTQKLTKEDAKMLISQGKVGKTVLSAYFKSLKVKNHRISQHNIESTRVKFCSLRLTLSVFSQLKEDSTHSRSDPFKYE